MMKIGVLKAIGLTTFIVLAISISANAQSFLSYRKVLDTTDLYGEIPEDSTSDIAGSDGVMVKPLEAGLKDSTSDAAGREKTAQLPDNEISTELYDMLLRRSAPTPVPEQLTLPDIRTRDLNETVLEEIDLLIQRGEVRQSLAMIEGVVDNLDEKPLWSDTAYDLRERKQFLLIKAQYQLGDYESVIEASEFYFQLFGNGNNYYQAYYYFASALTKLGKPLEYVSLVTDEFFQALGIREGQNLRRFIIEDAIRKNELVVAMDFIVDSERNVLDGFEVWIETIIENIDDIRDIESIVGEYENNLVRSYANLRRIQIMVRDGAYEDAREGIDRLFLDETIHIEMLDEIQRLQRYVDIALNTNPRKIGVILPFSHNNPYFRLYAQQVSDGLELALTEYSSEDEHFQLVFKDSARAFSEEAVTGENTTLSIEDRIELVKKRVRELVEEDQVIAILGPLAKDTSIAAGEVAESYKVPIISFSQTENLGKDLPFLFRFQRNQIQEARFLAKYAYDYLQAERFVLFYNEDRTGKGYEIMRAFKDTIQEKGGKVVGVTGVGRSKVDFKQNYLAMTGGLQPLSEEDQDELQASGEKITPIVDFDAMFVPTPIDQLGFIMAFNRSFNAEKVWVLAGSDVNIQENQLLSRTSRLRFVDSFPISGVRTYLQPFFESHWKQYNYRNSYRPPTDYTIYAYEAFEVLAKLLNDPGLYQRESLRNAIASLSDFPILTGNVSVSENGEFEKQLNVLRIKEKTTLSVF